MIRRGLNVLFCDNGISIRCLFNGKSSHSELCFLDCIYLRNLKEAIHADKGDPHSCTVLNREISNCAIN